MIPSILRHSLSIGFGILLGSWLANHESRTVDPELQSEIPKPKHLVYRSKGMTTPKKWRPEDDKELITF